MRKFHYFYPHPPRGGRQKQPCTGATTAAISIHTLREEGDDGDDWFFTVDNISIHTLREEGD